jgi:hypothetical protein
MALALPTQGITKIRDSIGTLATHVGISTNQSAFSTADTVINPGGSGTNLIKTSTVTTVNPSTVDVTMDITGSSEFTDLEIWTISVLDGATASDIISRFVRTVSIGCQAGDVFTIGARLAVADAS